jgi:hypothetical protein
MPHCATTISREELLGGQNVDTDGESLKIFEGLLGPKIQGRCNNMLTCVVCEQKVQYCTDTVYHNKSDRVALHFVYYSI